MNIGEPLTFKSDGGVQLPRQWAKSVFHDLLCRNLPVLRKDDVERYVHPDSEIPFRKSAACAQCHASVDQFSGVIRGSKYSWVGGTGPLPGAGAYFATVHTPDADTQSEAEDWPPLSAPWFSQAPPKGKVLYRNHHGELVDVATEGLPAMGTVLAALEGPYVCAAKRYYQYFTGIDVDIGDVNDAARGVSLTELDLEHREFVIGLGKSLMKHQNTKILFKEIFSSKYYKN